MSTEPNSRACEQHHHLHPNVIHDSSADSAGIIASELAAEDGSLLNNNILKSHSYGAIEGETPDSYEIDDPHGGYALPKRQLITVVSSLFMASFLAALDVTVVTTLLTIIASELKAVKNISWIATSYLLSSSAFQPIFGKLSDIFGRKFILIGCSLMFGIGCTICVTDSLWWLVIGRFITGWGGSGLTAVGTITMSDLIPLRDRGLYQGLANICYALGAASGGFIGGIVADTLGWKYVFILQVPLAIIVGIAIYLNLNLPAGSPGLGAHGQDIWQKLKRVDFLGSFCLISSLMLFLTAASLGGRDIAFSSNLFISLVAASFVLLFAFLYVEAYVSEEPIIPIELLANRTVLASSLTNWFYTMGIFAILFYVPVYFTSVLYLSATENGLRLVPNFFGVSLGSLSAGYYMKRTGRYYNLAVAAGILAIFGSYRVTLLDTQTSTWQQYLMLIPQGLGYSCILTITLLALIAATPMKYQACTTSIQYTFRSTGSTLGVSAASAIFETVLGSSLQRRIMNLVKDPEEARNIIAKALEDTNYVHEAPKYVREAIRTSYDEGCRGAFYFASVAVVIGVISSLFMREHKLHTSLNRD
ncbi:hypothetical protein CANMA_003370 [Candida margitis]|uniref:uncharacterized protein n=1 Tax=Candida margitis TaxID=1775924 RepID=UPI002227C7C7|nr:uncharacterized protein CANMA_003370 [Candida margitis]KAI5966124.1 hypothetical protein CANMA_003370 [Candida margitis]